MSAVITNMLGTDSFSGSRVVINANFQSLKTELDTIESIFGLSLTSGNIDISGATGGQILAKKGAFNDIILPASGTSTISLTGSTGAMIGKTLSLLTSLTTPLLNVQNIVQSVGTTSIFNGDSTFNGMVKILDGLVLNKINLGTLDSTHIHIVKNTDCVVLFTLSVSSPGALVIQPDINLLDGHIVTLVDTTNVATTLDTTYIMGFASGTITFDAAGYKSSITLMWSLSDNKWIIINSSNMTIT